MGEREGSPSQGRPQDRLRASGAIFLYHASRDTGDGIRDTGDGRRETEDGRRETEGGRRETGDGRRETGDGKRETGYGRRETEYGRRVRGDGRRETDDGRRETGDGRRETGEKEKTTASKSSRILCFNAQAGARRTGKYFISRANGNIKKIFFLKNTVISNEQQLVFTAIEWCPPIRTRPCPRSAGGFQGPMGGFDQSPPLIVCRHRKKPSHARVWTSTVVQ